MFPLPPCYSVGDVLYIPFDTYDANGASVTISGFAVTDIEVYKNGSVTQRASDNGYALLDTDGTDFDGATGLHGFSIDTGDNSDSGFWSNGATYWINVNAITIDSQTVRFTYVLALGYSLRPTTKGRELDVTSTGGAGIDWSNVENPTSTVGLTNTTISTTQAVASVTGAVGSVTAGVTVTTNNDKTGYGLADDAITASKYDESTAFPVKSADTGSTQIARVGADGDTLETLSDQLDTKASQTSVDAIQNNTRVVRVVPQVIERPDSGTQLYLIHIYLYDDVGNMEAPDSAPTLALADQGGTNLGARLDSATGALVGTGHYKWEYTASSTDDLEQLLWEFSVVEGGATRLYGNTSVIVDTSAVDFTSADRTKLDAIHTMLPSKSKLTGTNNSDGDVEMNESTGDFNATQQTRIQTQATASLNAYDPPTRTEATSDKNEILAEVATAAEIVAAIRAGGDVDGFSIEEALILLLAMATGELSGAATTEIEIRAADDSKVRITATVDTSGNRSAVTLDAS